MAESENSEADKTIWNPIYIPRNLHPRMRNLEYGQLLDAPDVGTSRVEHALHVRRSGGVYRRRFNLIPLTCRGLAR